MNYTLPDTPFTNRAFAVANGWTVDAAEKHLRRRYERGEFTRERQRIFDDETRRHYYTFVYFPNSDYISPQALIEQKHDQRCAALRMVSDAIDEARTAEDEAIKPYINPNAPTEWFDQYEARHREALKLYFADHSGAQEAHDAREAAAQVIYNLRFGHPSHEQIVLLAGKFSWGNKPLPDVRHLLADAAPQEAN